MFKLAVIYAIVCLRFHKTHGEADLKILLSPKGQLYGTKAMKTLVEAEIRKLKIPDIDQPDLKLKNVKILNFNCPDVEIKTIPPHGLKVSTKNGLVEVSGYVDKQNVAVLGSVAGNFHAIVKNIRVSLGFQLEHERGAPKMAVDECSVDLDIDTLNVDMSGFVNTMMFVLKPMVKAWAPNFAADGICNAVKTQIHTTVNQKIPEAMHNITLLPGAVVDILMNKNPVTYENGYLQADVTASIHPPGARVTGQESTSTKEIEEAAQKVATDVIQTNTNMAFVVVPDSLLNSVAKGAFSAGILKIELNKDDGKIQPMLRSTCGATEVCIGRIFPELAEEFVNKSLAVVVKARAPPTFLMQPGRLVFKGGVDVQLLDSKTNQVAIAFNVETEAFFKAKIEDGVINSGANITKLEGQVTQSRVAALKGSRLSCALEFLRPIINSALKGMVPASIKLPLPQGKVELSDLDLEIVDHAMKIAADVAIQA